MFYGSVRAAAGHLHASLHRSHKRERSNDWLRLAFVKNIFKQPLGSHGSCLTRRVTHARTGCSRATP